MASALRPALLRQFQTANSRIAPSTLRQSLIASRVQRSAFQTSAALRILPALPQVIHGGVNDPARILATHPSHGSYHWTAERTVSLALVPLTVMPFAVGSLNPMIDGAFIGLIILHTYIGFQSVITDYLPTWRVPGIRKTVDWLNVLAVFVVGWGWYEFETNDVGLTEAVKRIWRAGANAKEAAKEAEKKLS